MSTNETPAEAYDRGAVAGEISARLAYHDQHFEHINGSIGKVADELRELGLRIQHLADQRDADAKTVIATAAALRVAEDARRARSVVRWQPVMHARLVLGLVVSLITLITLAVTFYLTARP